MIDVITHMNICCLYPRYFEAIKNGEKHIEYRFRKKYDPRLDAIEPGEYIVFLECGSKRAIGCQIIATERVHHMGHRIEYRLHLSRNRKLMVNSELPHLQGFRRIQTNKS